MGEEPLSKMKSENQKPETVSRDRLRQTVDEAQHLLEAGHPDKAEEVMRRLSMPSPSARDSEHAEVGGAGVGKMKRVKRLTQKRRPGKSPQQVRQRYALLLYRGKLKQAAAYFHAHTDDIMAGLLAKPVEVYENTAPLPDHKPDLADLAAHYEKLLADYKAESLRRWKVKEKAKTLGGDKLVQFVQQNKSVFTTPDPVRPIKPAALLPTTPKLDGRTGFRKQVSKKTKALTNIQKRMAEEKRKAEAAKEEKPRPVMKHHTTPNPWLNR